MKYTLSLVCCLLCVNAIAQYAVGLQIGPAFDETNPGNRIGSNRDYTSKVMPVVNLFAYTNIGKGFNMGGALYTTGYSVKNNIVMQAITLPAISGKSSYDEHKSYYCFIGPLFNFAIDKKQQFSFSFVPAIGFLLYGKESGYLIGKNRNDSIDNSSRYIKKEVLAFEADFKYCYPLKKNVFFSGSAGFILGGSVSRYAEIPVTKLLVQMGLRYDITPKGKSANIIAK